MTMRRRRVRISVAMGLVLLVGVVRWKRPEDLLLFLVLLALIIIIVVVGGMAVLDADDGARKVRRTTEDDENAVVVVGLVNALTVPNADNDSTVRMRRVDNRWRRMDLGRGIASEEELLRLFVVIVVVFIVALSLISLFSYSDNFCSFKYFFSI